MKQIIGLNSYLNAIKNDHNKSPNKESGAVLLTGLIILLVLTLIGTGSMTSVTLDEKIVRNLHVANRAFIGAETGLADAKAQLLNFNQTTIITPYGQLDTNSPDWWDDSTFWNDPTFVNQLTSATATELKLTSLPRYVIEYIGDGKSQVTTDCDTASECNNRHMYRITAFSEGVDANTQSVVQSIFICSGACRAI